MIKRGQTLHFAHDDNALDASGRRIAQTREDNLTERYAYDDTSQLTGVDYGTGKTETFSYDPVGNRVEVARVVPNAPLVRENYQSNSDELSTDELSATPVGDMLSLIAMPRYALVTYFKDQLFPRGRFSVNQMYGPWMPWRNPKAGAVPQSYLFKHKDGVFAEISLMNTHLSGWRKVDRSNPSGEREISVRFAEPVKSNGVVFPSVIEHEERGVTTRIVLSNIDVKIRE